MVENPEFDFKKIQSYYSRSDVQKAILEVAKGREIVSVFKDGKFGRRPDILQYPADIEQAVREGAVSFHGSVERWKQPMKLDAGATKQQLDELRSGWDVFVDVDVPDFEIAKTTVKQVISALKDHGVSSFGLKYSVDYNEPIVIQDGKKIDIVEIGRLVDSIIENSKNVQKILTIDGEKAEVNSFDVACFNPQNLKIEFKPASFVLRHKINEPLYEVKLKTGRVVKVSGSHSLFVLEEGQIKSKIVSELKVGDYVIIPKLLPNSTGRIEEINLVKELLNLPKDNIRSIYIENVANIDEVKSTIENKWIKRNRFPLHLLKDIKIQDYGIFKNSFLNIGSSTIKIPAIIKISKELMRLLGYYVAEGFCLTKGTYDVILSFGSHENLTINDAKICIKKVFNTSFTERTPHESSLQLLFGGKLLTLIFEKILRCGKYSFDKRVPPLVFSLSNKMKKEFLKGYFCDATVHKNREIQFKTVSKFLASDLSYLFLQLNIVTSITTEEAGERTFPQGYTSKTKKVFKIGIHSCLQTERIKEIVPSDYRITETDNLKIQSPVSIPTNHSGLRQLYYLIHMKRNPKMRSRIFHNCCMRPDLFLETVNYIENCQIPDLEIVILKQLLKKPMSTTELSGFIKTKNLLYRILKKLEKDNLVLKSQTAKSLGRGGLPTIWSVSNKEIIKNRISEYEEKRKIAKSSIDFLKVLAQSDLGFAPVKSIKKIIPNGEYVYDISVKNCENFVGGFGGVILHNTGGKSFHIGVPFEALPEKIDMKPMAMLYPEAMERIIEYLKWYVNEPLRDALLSIATPAELADRAGKPLANIISEQGIEPFKIVNVDIFGSRHMFRLPYSLHEKSLLVSLPLKIEQIDKFQKEDAASEKVKVVEKFLIRETKKHDVEALVVEAFDWAAKYMKEKPQALPQPKLKPEKIIRIPEANFPPCVQAIYRGLVDGRKRSVFILINFLRNMGWKPEEIEQRLLEWNEKNYPPMPTNYIRTQLRWHLNQQRNILPPNCDNDNFYLSFNVCKPDEVCKGGTNAITIKNPINYAFRKMRREGKGVFDEKKRKVVSKIRKRAEAFRKNFPKFSKAS